MLERLDPILLGFFQRKSNDIQAATGISCFQISQIFFLLSWTGIVPITSSYLREPLTSYVVMAVVIFLSVPSLSKIFWKVEQRTVRNPKLRNELEFTFVDIRTYLFLMTVGWILIIVCPTATGVPVGQIGKGSGSHWVYGVLIDMVAMTVGIYFGSCTPKPPSESKFKKTIRKLTSPHPHLA